MAGNRPPGPTHNSPPPGGIQPDSLAARDLRAVLHPYTNLRAHEQTGPLVMTRGEGVYVFDDQGREYIEGMAGLWCCALGFSETRLADAAARQMR